MGEVRDAKLKPGWGLICLKCRKEFTDMKAEKLRAPAGLEFLGGMMGMK